MSKEDKVDGAIRRLSANGSFRDLLRDPYGATLIEAELLTNEPETNDGVNEK